MPGGAVVLDRILIGADAGEPRDRKRTVVAAALDARRRRRCAIHAPLLERLEILLHDRRGGRRPEDVRAAHSTGAVIDVPVRLELAEVRGRLLGATKMLFNICK